MNIEFLREAAQRAADAKHFTVISLTPTGFMVDVRAEDGARHQRAVVRMVSYGIFAAARVNLLALEIDDANRLMSTSLLASAPA